MIEVKSIFINERGEQVGAEFIIDGKLRKYSTNKIKDKKISCTNAKIDGEGIIDDVGIPKRIVKKAKNEVENREIRKANEILNKNVLNLYHGNKDKYMIPEFGKGKSNNDYGKGLYTTEDAELAKEWAWCEYTKGEKGLLHEYRIDISGLNILNFTELISLHWLAELYSNRSVNVEGKEALIDVLEQFKALYKIDTSNYDIIIGYRADDSYFRYAQDFLESSIYLDTLEEALRYGELGLQVYIKSERAFKRLVKVSVEEVPKSYYFKYIKREERAIELYNRKRREKTSRKRQTIRDFLGSENMEGRRKTYNSFWLRSDMENMGYMFEYCDEYCMRLYKANIDKEKLLNKFMKSDIRKEMEFGNPKLLSQAAIDSLELFVNVDCGGIEEFRTDKKVRYRENQMYWIGWAYAYIHHKECIPFSELVDIITIEEMKDLYRVGHEMDIDVFREKIRGRLL